jgi:hypothetical protein
MRMKCNKLGRDSSGKANLIRDPDSLVWGVLWSFHASHWESLDRIEQGYRRIAIRAETPSGELLETETYVSSRLTADPVPFLSYKRWLEEGAREHDLPGPYRAFLEALPARPGPKTSA